jgi:hypothetical protein
MAAATRDFRLIPSYDSPELRQRGHPVQLDTQQSTIRMVNRTIRDFADDPRIGADEPWEFFCECGCFTLVELTIAQFDEAGEVWADGHGERMVSA